MTYREDFLILHGPIDLFEELLLPLEIVVAVVVFVGSLLSLPCDVTFIDKKSFKIKLIVHQNDDEFG